MIRQKLAAPHYLPAFITAPGETGPFLVGSALPEHLAHRNARKLQFEVVAVLALIALFTHNNTFWVAAPLLALVPIPNFHGPLAGMAESLVRIVGWRRSPSGGAGPRGQSVSPPAEAGSPQALLPPVQTLVFSGGH